MTIGDADLTLEGWAPGPGILASELAVVGATLHSRQALEEAAEHLAPGDVYGIAAPTYAAALALLNDGKPTDPAAILGELQRNGDLERAGGGPTLAKLMEHACPPSAVSYHARRISEDARRRRIHNACTTARKMTESPSWHDEADTAVDTVRKLIDEAALTPDENAGDVVSDMVALLDEWENPPAELAGIVPPYLDLAHQLGTFAPGQLIVVGGRPSMGKSTVAADTIRYASIRGGKRTVMFTLEMSRREVLQRLAAAEAQVNIKTIRERKVSPTELERLVHAATRISGAPLEIDDQAGCTLERIRSRLRSAVRSGPLGIVIVDYLQLLTGPKTDNREQQVAALSRGLKLLAMEFETPVMLLSQLNRESEKRIDKKPGLSDLRESGAVEQDSDVVVLVHRPDFYEPEGPRAGEADLIIAKNRAGQTGTATVANQLHYSRFVDIAWSPTRSV
jgi:replicative DNA helicase